MKKRCDENKECCENCCVTGTRPCVDGAFETKSAKGPRKKLMIMTSTGCPAMDALDLADAVLEGSVTGKEIIAKLLHINDLINRERERGEAEIVPAHVAAMPTGNDSGSGLYQ